MTVGSRREQMFGKIAIIREIHTHTGQIIYIAKMRKGQLDWKYD